MDLYDFGFNGHALFPEPSKGGAATSTDPVLTPRRIIHGKSINILWASWCDALIIYSSANPLTAEDPPSILYTGIGITVKQLNTIRDAVARDRSIQLFGSDLSDGIKGMIEAPSLENSESHLKGMNRRRKGEHDLTPVTFFASDYEVTSIPGTLAIQTIEEIGHHRVRHVAITSGGAVNVAADVVLRSGHANHIEQRGEQEVLSGSIIQFKSLAQMKMWLEGSHSPSPRDKLMTRPTGDWKQFVSNSISSTALTEEGKVYTWATDKRYLKCLGRDPEEHEVEFPAEVTFLSETNVKKIASGGYMTAALSADGELFLWGQACPGIQGELDVLHNDADDEDDDQDEFVKCVELQIQGKSAKVLDVAVGCGHVLIAAEVEVEGEVVRSVFAAGQCEYGQLGIGRADTFVSNFVEVPGFAGTKIVSLAAAGWSSWVIVENDE